MKDDLLKEDDEKKALKEENEKLKKMILPLKKLAYEYQHETLCRRTRPWCVVCGIDLTENPQPEHAGDCPFAREN